MTLTPKDILTNQCFCPIPWTGFMYNYDGTVRNCIRGADKEPIGNIKENTIQDILLGERNLTRQENILNNTPIPSCRGCYDLEQNKKSFDIISDRVFYIKELKETPLSTYTLSNFDLQTIDIRWSNLCNFSCVYCGPEYSSRWVQELNLIDTKPSDEQQQNLKNYIFDNAHKLKHVYLAGGEPLLMKENLELLDKLSSDANIRINTNLSKVDTRVFERVCKFKNVHWIVSAETIEEEYNYIRHGGSWTDFLDNLNYIKQLDHKITFNMLYFILNFCSLFSTIDYFKKIGFHNNAFVVGALLNPEYLNIRNLPKNVLQSVKETLEERINAQPGFLLEDGYRNLLKYIQTPYDANLRNSFDQLYLLDQRRQLNSKEIFKDLYQLKELQ